MRFPILVIIIALISQNIQAQAPSDTLPDIIQLSKKDIQKIYQNKEDTLGFRQLTSKTSLKEYKGKENRRIRRTLRSIKSSIINRNIIYNTICRNDIQKNRKEQEAYILYSPKYRLTNKGIILIGESRYLAPWNDIVSEWKIINYYFIDYSKNVKLVETVRVNRRKLKSVVGIVEFLPEALNYNYPDSLAGDSIIEQIHPVFSGGIDSLKKYIEGNTTYSEFALEYNIQGRTTVIFTINPDKSISGIKILRGIDPSIDKEVIRVIKGTHGMWLAGTVNGKEIPVEVVLSIKFKIINN